MGMCSTASARIPFAYDPLRYLVRTKIIELSKGRVIYDDQQFSDHLYAVVFGRVKLTITTDGGRPVVARILPAESLFGDSAIIGHRKGEAAVAIDRVGLFSWPISEVEAHIELEPRLGLALLHYAARQTV